MRILCSALFLISVLTSALVSEALAEDCRGAVGSSFAISARLAEVIATGTVTDVELGRHDIGWTDLMTFVTLDVDTVLAGPDLDEQLTFWIPLACTKDEWRTRSHPPLPAFGVKDRFLVLLEADAAGELYCRGTALEVRKERAQSPMDIWEGNVGAPLRCYESVIDSVRESRSPSALSRESSLVGVVRVRNVRSAGRGDDRREVVTASVQRGLKGKETGEELVIELPVHPHPLIADVPLLREGDLALLFLEREASGSFRVVGGRMGMCLVDSTTGVCQMPTRRNAIPALPPDARGKASELSWGRELGALIDLITRSSQEGR